MFTKIKVNLTIHIPVRFQKFSKETPDDLDNLHAKTTLKFHVLNNYFHAYIRTVQAVKTLCMLICQHSYIFR